MPRIFSEQESYSATKGDIVIRDDGVVAIKKTIGTSSIYTVNDWVYLYPETSMEHSRQHSSVVTQENIEWNPHVTTMRANIADLLGDMAALQHKVIELELKLDKLEGPKITVEMTDGDMTDPKRKITQEL